MMDINDIELKLLCGQPVNIDGGLLHSPKLKNVIRIGEALYSQHLSAILFDKKHIDGIEDDENYESYDTFELLCAYCYHNENFFNIFLDAVEFIFKERPTLDTDESEVFFIFGDELNNWKIDKSNFSTIQKVIRISNYLKDEEKKEDYNPANERAKKFIEKLKKNKADTPKPKETMNLHSIISGLSWKLNNINILNCSELTVYQLYNGFFTTEKIDNYQFTLSGIYAGNVDGKKINYKDIHWAKIQENK